MGGEGDASILSSIVCVYTNDGRTDGAYTQGRGGRRCLLVLGISGGKPRDICTRTWKPFSRTMETCHLFHDSKIRPYHPALHNVSHLLPSLSLSSLPFVLFISCSSLPLVLFSKCPHLVLSSLSLLVVYSIYDFTSCTGNILYTFSSSKKAKRA